MTPKLARLVFLLAVWSGTELAAQIGVSGQLMRGSAPSLQGVADALLLARPAPSAAEDALDRLGETSEDDTDGAVSVRADASGRFRLELPAPGLWRIEIDAGDDDTLLFDLPIVENRELGRIELPRLTPLVVSVRGDDGEPLPGARVAVSRHDVPSFNASPRFAPVLAARVATADENGVARLARVAEGRPARLAAAAPGHLPASLRVHGSRLAARLERAAPSAWRLLEPSGAPAKGAVALLDGVPIARADDGGRLELAVPRRGLERVELVSPTGAARTTALIPTPGSPQPERAQDRAQPLALEPAVEATGRVLSSGSRSGIAGALVSGHGVATTTDGNGDFVLRVPPPDRARPPRLWLTARAPGHLPTSDGTVSSAPGPVRLDLEMETGVAVRGVVVAEADGVPVDEATIAAGDGDSATTDDDGSFLLRASLRDLQHVSVRHPDFAPRFLAIGPDELPPEQPSVRIELTRGRSVTGWVVDPEDQPVRGAEVELNRRAQDPRRRASREGLSATTDAAGSFRVEHLAADTYDLEVTAPSFVVARVPGLEIGAGGGEIELGTVALDRAATLEVLVTDPDGVPIAGAEVRHGPADAPSRPWRRPEGAAETGADGLASIDHQAHGARVWLAASYSGYLTATGQVEAPTIEPLVLTLRPGLELTGRVTDLEGVPISDAQVQAEGLRRGFGRARTDPAGRFVLSELLAGEYRLVALADGYLSETVDGIVLAPGDGAEHDPIELRLSAGATLEGRVVDPDGDPLEGMIVAARIERERRGPPRARSDADGTYRLEGLPLGTLTLSVDGNGRRGVVRDVVLESGVNRADFELEGALEISGRVLDPEGRPVAEAEVFARGPAARPRGFSQTGPDGEFRREIDDGASVTLVARKRGVGASSEVGPIRVQGASISGIELRLERGGAITGRVVGLELDELSEVRVLAAPAHEQSPWSRMAARPDYEGRFRIELLAPGEWLVTASHGGRTARASATLDDATSEASVELVFEPGFALTGLVLDGGLPVEAATVEASGIDVLGSGLATTDGEGRFEIADLTSGSWRLVVNAARSRTRHTETVEIDGDRDVVIELPSARVSGVVVEEDGAPVPGAFVELRSAADVRARSVRSSQRTSAQGLFELEGVTPGRWVLEAREGDRPPARVEIEVDELGADGIRLELPPAGDEATELYLLSPNGDSIRQARVVLVSTSGGPSVERRYVVREGGRIVLDDVAPGRWLVAVQAGPLIAEAEITVPARPRRLMLQEPAFVEIVAPELVGTGTIRPVELGRSPVATPFDPLWLGATRQPRLVDGRTTLGPIPPGSWRVAVEIEPGRILEQIVNAVGNRRVRVELE